MHTPTPATLPSATAAAPKSSPLAPVTLNGLGARIRRMAERAANLHAAQLMTRDASMLAWDSTLAMEGRA
ncbi:hypothetical protein BH11PLA1_BH11PLA1_17170 [soil metagenome]